MSCSAYQLIESFIAGDSVSADPQAATNLCSLVKDKECQLGEAEVKRLEALASQCEECCSFCSLESTKLWCPDRELS